MCGERSRGREHRFCSRMGWAEPWFCCFQPHDLGPVNLSVLRFLQLKMGIIAVPVREGNSKYRRRGVMT